MANVARQSKKGGQTLVHSRAREEARHWYTKTHN